MKYLASLVVSLLVPSLVPAGPLEPPVGFDSSDYGAGAPYFGAGAFSDDYSRYGDRRPVQVPDPEWTDAEPGGRPWVAVPPGLRGQPAWDPYRSEGYSPYGSPERVPGLYEQLRSGGGASDDRWARGGRFRAPGAQPDPRSLEESYRFRDWGYGASDPMAQGSWHRGYRFRPLTPQERARPKGQPGWRPLDPNPPPATRSGRAGHLPEMEEAYGYRTDGWFEHYYGDGWR